MVRIDCSNSIMNHELDNLNPKTKCKRCKRTVKQLMDGLK